jgi:hypothetical protein
MIASSTLDSRERADLEAIEFRRHGILAGLFGALLLAVWFFVIDVMRGHPLFTPTLLMRALLAGSVSPDANEIEPSVGATLMFTCVHGLAFAAIGFTVAEFLRFFDLVHSRSLMIVLLFGALCIAFFTFGIVFAVVGPHGITMRDAFAGNALAAFGMAGYLGRVLGGNARD